MSKAYNSLLQQKLEDLIESLGGREGGQTKAAALIGYSTGTLSTYRNSKYNGDVVKLEAKLVEIFGNQQEAATLHNYSDYVPTSISSQVYDTIRICHLKGGLAIECGDAGIGKTKAAQKYVEDYPNTSFYVAVNPCFTSVTAFLKLLCRRMRLPIGRKDDMWIELDECFRGGKKVLIVDEAQHLPIKTIDALRSFFDENSDLGIIFIGNVETVSNRNGRTKESFAQIKNRTKLTEIRHTQHITKKDIGLLFPTLSIDEKAVELLHVVAQSDEGIRGASNLYSNARDNENTTYEGLLAMAKSMRIMIF